MKSSPLLIIISAPSGAGKTTLCQQILQRHPQMTRAITCTTRQPRVGERDGVDYYFLDNETFQRHVAEGKFLEHATVYGRSYGTLKSEVLDKLGLGKDVLLNIDVQGAASVSARAQADPELERALVTVFLAPPSVAELEARLKKRATDSQAELDRRLAVVRREVAAWTNFQYLIVSATIPEDVRRMEVILEAERMRQHRVEPPDYD